MLSLYSKALVFNENGASGRAKGELEVEFLGSRNTLQMSKYYKTEIYWEVKKIGAFVDDTTLETSL